MIDNTRRMFPRVACETEIRCGACDSGSYHGSQVYNYSQGGLYLESEMPVVRNTKISLILPQDISRSADAEDSRRYIGEVKWVKQLNGKRKAPRFAAGVQFLGRGREIMPQAACQLRVACHLCCELTPADQLSRTAHDAQLCPGCTKHLARIPAGRLKKSIERFLCGNVV
jgi:hypothetical protein